MAKTKSIDNITLSAGSHPTRSHGVCFMEAVAWIVKEKHSDHPACVCPVFGEFARTWNDRLGNADRQKMKPYLVMSIGTSNDGYAERRAWMIIDWSVRGALAVYCEARNLKDLARDARALPEIRDWDTAKQASKVLNSFGRALARAFAITPRVRALARALTLDLALERALGSLDIELFNESGFALMDRLLTISLEVPQLQGGTEIANVESKELEHAR